MAYEVKVMAAPLPVGILHSGVEAVNGQQIAALLKGLAEAGYVDGDNIAINLLWSNNDSQQLATNAATLVTAAVKVIIAAGGTSSAKAAKEATNQGNPPNPIPVVFTTVADPVAAGFVTSLDEPGGNLTGTAGLTSELDPKRLELLKEFDPSRTRIGILTNSSRLKFADQWAELQAAATRLGLTPIQGDATRPNQIDNAINGFPANTQAVLVTADALFNNERKKVVRLVNARGLPAIYQWRDFAAGGGLMSYGPSIDEAYQQAGVYASQILGGDKPQNLPVMLPSKYDLVINLKTANKQNLKIPISMLTRAILLRRK